MLDESFIPVSTTKLNNLRKFFVDLQELLVHPHLNDEMRFLWVWLAAQTAAGLSFCCVISYENIALRLNKSLEDIHYSLLRLRISGFLVSDFPLYFGDFTPEMIQEPRVINLLYPYKRFFKKRTLGEKECKPVPPQRTEHVNINLIKNKKEEIIPPQQSFIKRKPRSFGQKVRRLMRVLKRIICQC